MSSQSNNTKPKLGVVIVTYNRLKLLKECLDACINQTVPFSEIIVVDNASTDGTAEFLNSNKRVTPIALKENIGGSGGFYEGLKFASEKTDLDYILLIDDDAIPDAQFNEHIYPYISENQLMAVSGTVITDEQIQPDHRSFIGNSYRQKDSRLEDYDKEYFDCDLASFCGLYISRQLIKKIGLPRADFFIWLDDTEYSLRIRNYTKIRNINKAIITHKTSLQERKTYHWKNYYGIRNKYIMIQQHFPRQLPKFIFKKLLQIIYYSSKPTTKNRAIAKMYKDALSDAKHNKLGKSKKYNSNFTFN